ncbi:MAG: hypothetical protein KVP17_000333 [Porospora cf. gigantea B]|uniref:uncharacterized protein n=1 Tax=Porospora cf. gigantea B TaxID=2853592 RepID=UPI003571916C|nr:MAG: hypothetical protein KVP17_000333 [Porospora cf. gigantea B]
MRVLCDPPQLSFVCFVALSRLAAPLPSLDGKKDAVVNKPREHNTKTGRAQKVDLFPPRRKKPSFGDTPPKPTSEAPRTRHKSKEPNIEPEVEHRKESLERVLKKGELVVGSLLGQGGEGAVYKATLRGKPVAVKVYTKRSHLERELDVYRALQSERPRAKYFLHCHFSSNVRIGNEERPCLVLEYNAPGTLRRTEPVRMAQATKIARDVALALSALHDRGCAHLDVKAANIMSPTAEGAPYRLSDFGFTKLLAADQILPGSYGTQGYTAPEIVLHGRPTLKSDVFSLGITLAESASGERFLQRPRFREIAGCDAKSDSYYRQLFERLKDSHVEQELQRLRLPSKFTQSVAQMVRLQPESRLSISSVLERFAE